ncbi:hypothetical protein N8160_03555 [Pelagibacteraceae bacterium]|jgi:hypothetical protein|nr:hypothetical protein [Pelagibacteraceae bacterium]
MKKFFGNYPASISMLLPIPWAFVSLLLTNEFFSVCSLTTNLIIMSSFSIFILPNWIGLFITDKRYEYFIGGLFWGIVWTVGLVATVGMDCK